MPIIEREIHAAFGLTVAPGLERALLMRRWRCALASLLALLLAAAPALIAPGFLFVRMSGRGTLTDIAAHGWDVRMATHNRHR